MATITQAIASLEQQLRELFGENTLPIRCYGAPAPLARQIDESCIIIVGTSSKHISIAFYLLYNDAGQIESRVLDIAEKCNARWHVRDSIGWYQQEGTIYRTYGFGLACE